MGLSERYWKNKEKLINDKKICKANRDLFREFFDFEERKLKRINDLRELDESCYKTLYGFIHKLRNVNSWFKNKPWKDLTKEDIEKVWNDLEDGKILTIKGTPFKDRQSYYNKVMKSKPFQLVGKADLCRETIEFKKKDFDKQVRFIEEDTFRKIADSVISPEQKCLCWLAFDIGENIFSLLQLQKKDFVKQTNPDTKEPEYIVNLPRDKIKRSRTTRSEITNFSETTQFLDIVLEKLKDEDLLFNFGDRQASKFLKRAVKITNARCIPNGQPVTWKDFRSSMACHLLKNRWTTDEIKSRMGHSPSSNVLNAYVNYLALGKHTQKKKIYYNEVNKLQEKLEKMEGREKLLNMRLDTIKNENEGISLKLVKQEELIREMREDFRKIARAQKIKT